MAIIQHKRTGVKVLLNALHYFGRSQRNQTTIPEPDVSKLHAVISWSNNTWSLQDQSRNGTLVSGKYVIQTRTTLKKGMILQFGQSEDTIWELINTDPPSSYMKLLGDKDMALELSNHHVYPNENDPIVSFYRSEDAKWTIDTGAETLELQDGNRYFFGDLEWLFIENESLEPTMDLKDLTEQAVFELHLSEDEEEVSMKVRINNLIMDLEVRIRHYLVLILVRQKIADLQIGLASEEAGWIRMQDVVGILKKELLKPEIDVYYVNLQIHRLRKQLMELKPHGSLFSNLIVRKSGSLQFRYAKVEIWKGGKVIDSFDH